MDNTEQEKLDPIKRLLWLDIETTGLDHDTLEVLEVAWFVTEIDLEPLTPLESRVLAHPGLQIADPFVLDMHTNNGLLADVAEAKDTYDSVSAAILATMGSVEELEPNPVTWILAGTGVATFDKRIIENRFPFVHASLAYYTFDVGVIRRFLREVIVMPFTDAETEQLIALRPENHRAMGDVLAAWKESELYRYMILDVIGFEENS